MEQFGKIYPVARPRALLLRGRYLILHGRLNDGLSTLKSGLASARSLSMEYEEALAYFELGMNQASNADVIALPL